MVKYDTKDLVLVGGGHGHVQVIKRLAMQPVNGLRVTVISREVHTPYSGMLPGFIAGHYAWDDIHIDLAPLCAQAGVRLIAGTVSSLDLHNNLVHCDDRPPIRFDVLSINCGSAPAMGEIRGADQFGIPVKPINQFLPHWQSLLDRLRRGGKENFRLVIVGGGAGGVELALSIQYRLVQVERISTVTVALITAEQRLPVRHNVRVQAYLERELARRAIEVNRGVRIVAVEAGQLHTDAGDSLAFDDVLWVTQAAAQSWPADAGLAVDEGGFIRVNEYLQSLSHAQVFAAGDVADIDGHSRPKAGVHAVRHGPVLAENLTRMVCERPLTRHRSQRNFLSLISTGDRCAVASHRRLAARGAWVWYWKNWIDQRFMAKFRVGEEAMQNRVSRWQVPVPDESRPTEEDMRCGGCGAKLGSDLLARVLRRLQVSVGPEVVAGIGDDAAVLRPVANALEVHTIDGFRAMIDDPYLLGRIAAEHAINDIYAMGGTPRTALASVMVPYAGEALMEDDLYQIMAGALRILEGSGTSLVGGHSGEGAELTVGFAVTGTVYKEEVWQKHKLSVGDYLVLTKPIGTGVLLAAYMRARCRAAWFVGALQTMQHSNKAAMPVLHAAGVRACTDVTGFGLLGHLGEMARAANMSIELWPGAVPLLPGAEALMQAGIFSSLQEVNERAFADVDAGHFGIADPRVRMLLDPQTSGGLLAAVKPAKTTSCLAGLRAAGYSEAAVIGRVCSASEDRRWARLVAESGIESPWRPVPGQPA